MRRIALAVIADDSAIEDGFERMIKSLRNRVHGVFVIFTGVDDSIPDQIEQILKKNRYDDSAIVGLPWSDNFSDARNASFALAKGYYSDRADAPEWITWFDCDDVVPASFNFQNAVAEIDRKKAHAGLVNYDYKIGEDDVVLTSHFKERFFRADYPFRWIYPIHENCVGPIGTQVIKLDPETYTVKHLRGEDSSKRKRNQEMIKNWFKESGGQEPRALMFMGHQTLSMAGETERPEDRKMLLANALKIYQQFMKTGPADDEAYLVNNLCADILRSLGRFEDSINVDLQGVKMQPTWPTSYVSIAKTHYDGENYQDSITWAMMAIEKKFDASAMQINDRLEAAGYVPWMIIGGCCMKLEDYAGAVDAYRFALGIYADDFTQAKLDEAMKAYDASKEVVGHPTGETNAKFLHEINWGKRDRPSIAFFVPPSIEDWNPDILDKEGMGGTESSVIQLATYFMARGWRVAIFGQPGSWEGKHQRFSTGSIEWYSSSSFHPDEPFTVFVGLRAPAIFDMPVKADMKILWLHDLTVGPARYGDFGDRFDAVDAIICPSNFHAQHIIQTYVADDPWKADTHVILNGVDREKFLVDLDDPIDDLVGDLGYVRDPKLVVYASSPDRGLPRLLELWPEIAKREPDAKLQIYYGWDSIDAIIAAGLPTAPMLAHFKRQTIEKIEQLTAQGHAIYQMGRVNPDLLAVAFKQAGVMAYPANFNETFGIVFAQALTAGVRLVIPDMGSLPAMCPDYSIVVPGPPDSMEYGPRFVDAVIEAMNETTDEMRSRMPLYTRQMKWGQVGAAWHKMIESTIGPVKK